jgi:hypothetical protein
LVLAQNPALCRVEADITDTYANDSQGVEEVPEFRGWCARRRSVLPHMEAVLAKAEAPRDKRSERSFSRVWKSWTRKWLGN